MSYEDPDPLSGYGVYGSSSTPREPRKSAHADYDPADPHGAFDPEKPYEVTHLLRDIGPGDQFRRVLRFSTAASACAAAQLLEVLMPDEFDEDGEPLSRPILEVRKRLPDFGGSKWVKVQYSADLTGLADTMICGLVSANESFSSLAVAYDNLRWRHRFCDVADEDDPF